MSTRFAADSLTGNAPLITGALPDSVGDLGPALTRLDLNENDINSIPTEIGALTGLEVLDLDSNALASVPTDIGALAGLLELDLCCNALTAVPSEIAALTSLTELYLDGNQLTGVPAEFQTLDPSICTLNDQVTANPLVPADFSCANVGPGTSCCTTDNCDDTATCGVPAPPPPCTYADTTCAEGATCPGGTLVSAACADRSAFSENPCACTALQELAGLSSSLQGTAPWDNLANAAYCQAGNLEVTCAASGDGVQLPTLVEGHDVGLTGALPPSVGELGPSVTSLSLFNNAINSIPTEMAALTGLEYLRLATNALASIPTDIGALTGLTLLNLRSNSIASVPTEIGALTGLEELKLGNNALTAVPSELAALTGLVELALSGNQLTGVPAEFSTVDPSTDCFLSSNDPGFSCANVGAGTSCCTASNCPNGGTSTCYTPGCTFADTQCDVGLVCPGGTVVSAACADRSAFNENPCACTALQELAALSAANLAGQAPWSNLATASYCTLDSGNYPVSEPHWIAVPVSGGRAERLTDWRAGCSTTLTTTIWISTSGARWSTVWSCPMSVSVAG